MTADRDLDRMLSSWFEELAGTRAPEGLLERGLRRVDVTRQRPGWLVRDRWSSPRTSKGGPRRTWLLVAAMLLVGTGVIGAAVVGGRLLAPPKTPANDNAIANPTAPPSSSPSEVPSVPAPTDPGLPAQAGQFASVCDFGLVAASVSTANVGWVSTPSALYRTENTGRTWSTVTPSGWPTAPTSGQSGVASIFIDADTAYTFLPGTPATIAVTHDGGTTWVERALGGTTADQSPAFWFQTSSSGSLIFQGAPAKTDPSRVFATSDGGSTWAGPQAGPSEVKSGAIGLLGGECMHIATQSVLVRTLTPPGDTSVANRLQVSHDVGATWIDRTLPVGPQAPASRPSDLVDKQVITAWGDAGGRIVMALNVVFNGGSFDQIYTSLDDGRTWQYVKTPAPLHIGGGSQFLSATEWVLVADDASTFMSTVDGGATWRTTVGSLIFWVGSVSFASPDLGWLQPTCGASGTFAHIPFHPACGPGRGDAFHGLLQTIDGGRTWTPFGQQP